MVKAAVICSPGGVGGGVGTQGEPATQSGDTLGVLPVWEGAWCGLSVPLELTPALGRLGAHCWAERGLEARRASKAWLQPAAGVCSCGGPQTSQGGTAALRAASPRKSSLDAAVFELNGLGQVFWLLHM